LRMPETTLPAAPSPSRNGAPTVPRLRRVLTVWDLIFYGIVAVTPSAPATVFGLAQVRSHGHAVVTILAAMVAMVLTAGGWMCPEHLMNITCRPSCRVRLNWIVSLAFVYGTAVAWVVQGAGFLAGFATADITPPVGWRRAGGYAEFISTGVHDPLLAKAIVLSQSNTTVVLVGNDLCSVPRELTDRARQQVSAKTGIPAANIVITATHTHGAPEYIMGRCATFSMLVRSKRTAAKIPVSRSTTKLCWWNAGRMS
jgi:Neutral/alkaline non-lysosomal ceramidase, N-terminal